MGPNAERKSSRRKAAKFYILRDPPREWPSGREFLNQEEVCRGSGSPILSAPSPFQRGFRDYAVRPRFRVGKRLGRKPYDVERYSEYWLVSDRAKQLFDEIHASDFTYLAVDTEFDPGSEPTTYWLCILSRSWTRSTRPVRQSSPGLPTTARRFIRWSAMRVWRSTRIWSADIASFG